MSHLSPEILEHVSDAVLAFDPESRFAFANGRACELLGRDPQSLLGLFAWSVLPEDETHEFRLACERALRERTPLEIGEYRGPGERWLRVRILPTDSGLSVFLTDVTELKAVRAALRDSEERRQMVELATRDLVYDWDVGADRIRWSAVLHTALGYPRDLETTGLDWWAQRVHPEDRDRATQGLRRALESDARFWTSEYRFQHADGTHRLVQERGYVVRGAEGRPERMVGILADVTDRRRAEAELRAAKEQLEVFLRTMPDQAWLKDREGRYLFVNDAYALARELPAEEILGRTDFDLFPLPVAERFRARDARVVREGRKIRFEESLRGSDGVRRWYEEVKAPVRLAGGETVGTIGIARDITTRKRAERALQESEARFRQIADNVREVFWLMETGEDVERDSRLVYVSPPFERIFGHTVAELMADPACALAGVAPDQLVRVAEATRQAIAGAETAAEYRLQHPERGARWVRTRYFPVRDEHGRIYRLAGLTEDITERQEVEAHYQRLVETAPYGIYATDLQGRITEANTALAEIVGAPPESLFGRHFLEIADPEEHEALRERMRERAAGTVGVRDFEVHIRRPDGERRLLHVRAADIRIAGVHTGSQGAVRDITEERASELYLRRAERLASLGTLIGGVAHELNNPLAAIKSFSELLLLDERPDMDREALEAVAREADRAAGIVMGLRQLARDTQRQREPRREPLDLNEIVRHVVGLRRYALDAGRVSLEMDLAEDLAPVLGEPTELEQVVLNLVVNAEQALAGRDGPRSLVLRTGSSESTASLHVIDDGPGIAPEILGRIFDPFFTTRAPGRGTGLGLSLAHGIVAEHGGEIHVRSEPGHGAEFRVRLPCAPRGPASVRRAPSTRRASVRPLRVLVVDDEEAIRFSVSRFLARRGHDVAVAGDGEEALHRIAAPGGGPGFDVILSDLRMPGIGGEALLHRLREQGEGMDRRMVFMTGDAGHDLTGLDCPIIFKPFELDRVAQLIEDRADGRI